MKKIGKIAYSPKQLETKLDEEKENCSLSLKANVEKKKEYHEAILDSRGFRKACPVDL